MHHNKNIEKVSELKDFFVLEENLSDTFLDILKSFTTKSISEFLGVVKVRGYHAVHILEILVILPFLALSSVRALFYSGYAGLSEAQKDTFYRLKNNAHIDWRKFLYLIVKRFRFMAGKHGEEDQGPQCLIIDDSFLAKTGAKLEG